MLSETTITATLHDAGSPFALDFQVEAFAFDTQRAIGRLSAGAGLLQAICNRFGRTHLPVCLHDGESGRVFEGMTNRFGVDSDCVSFIPRGDLPKIADVGAILIPSPKIEQDLNVRRLQGEDAFSVVGLTHSLSSQPVMGLMSSLFFAPVNTWDAIICTSLAGKRAVSNMFGLFGEYLSSRGINAPNPPLQLPIIPLGVHCGRYERGKGTADLRRQFRHRRHIGDDDVVILSFGRLDPFTKMHPVPLYRAVEQAQRRLGNRCKLHLVVAGQSATEEVLREFLAASGMFAPSVRVHWVDGRQDAEASASWFGADIFCSLADNIQETFGLTPIEAMAGSLPCVVSDWSGYKETVVQGETGIRIATHFPEPDTNLGVYFSDRYAANIDVYEGFVGGVAQTLSVDIGECAEAFVSLASNPELREKLGKQGVQRAKSVYSWAVVLDQYVELFGELAKIRQAYQAKEKQDRTVAPAVPSTMDPYRVFGHFSSKTERSNTRMTLVEPNCQGILDALWDQVMCRFAEHALFDKNEVCRLLEDNTGREFSVSELVRQHPDRRESQLVATCQWLLKYGLLRVL